MELCSGWFCPFFYCVDKGFGVIDGNVGENAVPEVGNVGCAGKIAEHLLYFTLDDGNGREEFGGIEVSLERNGGAGILTGALRGNTPVYSETGSACGGHFGEGMPCSFGKNDNRSQIFERGDDLADIMEGNDFKIGESKPPQESKI